ncbi:GntR family transcriptional regulator [Amycolatopsis sp. NPDC051903]|uniref:GntR family transcriptional regulator n=1 Tax=Amycolatopsis sp. NPDC051903 TaxID=3363936 RepID=UPI00378F1082
MTSTDLTMLKLESFEPGRRIAADFIADSLRNAIQSGSLADGAVLKQAAIADHFEISRVPVREAMRQLLAEGLIELRAHHIAVVRGLSLERISEIYDNRALIEGYLLERAVPNIPVGVVKELRAAEKAMRGEDDHEEWLRLNGKFHRTMNEYAHDVTALELVAQLKSRAERYVRMWGTGGGLHRPEEAGAEHVEILDLVGVGDAKGARAAVERHIRTTGERLVAYGRSQQG